MSIKQLLLSATLVVSAFATAVPAAAASERYIGEVFVTAGNFCPRGTTKADGKLLPIANNTALFSILGTMYGGDGRATFALPDMRGRTIIGAGQGVALSNRRQGMKGGTEGSFGKSVDVTTGSDDKASQMSRADQSNMQPYLVMQHCIVAQGLYPSRS